ncbi:type III PLP-dependent enzyme [Oceanibacterium hippocampi]|uniref:ornithine decarboxylase n=1 Tax=Oceanibacterium hippocampi TaxID=745714 RepID=A0A1Y5SN43_9PROT|nr:type III PLP-dependent enzyme [Oceanibacterium hippocampi]SLN44565.1 Lysine/ornithine decarboxylase [Oceanibacterium hippocampi]
MTTTKAAGASGPRIYPNVDAVVTALRPSYPVFCVRAGRLTARARTFIEGFPGTVLYAVKCNPHPFVLRTLYKAGIHNFDSASLPEIALVSELFEEPGLFFHHPIKSRAAIQSAYRVYGVRHYTIDHWKELEKIREEIRRVEGIDEPPIIHVRVATPPSGASYELSRKFGATREDAIKLLDKVHEYGFECGISFHVGSQCVDPEAWRRGFEVVRDVLAGTQAKPRWINCGGGFPAHYGGQEPPPLDVFLDIIKEEWARLDLGPDAHLLCEPGRGMVADSVSLLVRVMLRKGDRLYLNDGVFGSLSEIRDANLTPPVRLIKRDGSPKSETMQEFTFYGPTCDSLDMLPSRFMLPDDVEEGDWIDIGQIGAYSNAVSSDFNGFRAETFVLVE